MGILKDQLSQLWLRLTTAYQTHPDRSFGVGMLTTSLVVIYIGFGNRFGNEVPIPFLLLYTTVVLAANLAGLWAGLGSALVATAFIIYSATISFGPPTLTGGPIQVMLGIALYTLTAYFLGRTKNQNMALIQQLRIVQASLEKMVEARTAELMAANRALQREIAERKQTEASLLKSEARYRVIVHDQTELISRSTPNQILTFVNDAYCRFFNRSPEEIIGQSFLNFIVPQSRQLVLDKFASISPENPVVSQEYQELRADGSLCWLHWTDRGIFDERGQLLEIQAVGQDVTKRKQAEEAMRRERDFSEAILDSLPGVFYLLDENQRFLRWNKNFTKITGYSDTEMAELRPLDFFRGPDKALVAERIQKVFAQGESSVEANFVAKDGPAIPYYFTGLRTILDGKACLLGVGINIAERKQVEEALQRYNERLTILHQIDQAILAAESPEKITRATLERLVQLVPYQWARVSLYDPDSQKTERIATFSLENFSIDPNIHLPASDTWSHLGELSQSKFHQVEDYLALEHPSVQPRSQITQDGPRITLAAPFITGEKLIGLMEMGRPEPDRFADEEIDISRQVADQLAIAIRQAQLHAQLHRRLDELTVVHRAGQQLQRLQTPVALAQAVIQVVEETLAYDYGTVLLIEPGSDCLLPFALSSQRQGPEFIAQDKAFVASHSPRVGKGITGWVAQTGQSVCLGDVRQDPRYYALRDENIRSELCVPLWAEEQIIGVINVESSRPNAYTEADQRVLETVAAQISVSIQNTHLLEQVERYATQLEQRVAERIAELEQQYRQQATLEERQRLVRDLHDAVSQSLFSASLLAEAIPRLWERHPAKARESLTDLYRLNRGALAEMRNLLLELRPAALAESKLEELLRQLTHAVGGRTQATISLEVKEEGNQLPVDTKIAIFRIAQEALNNITKHAEADRIWISLSSQHEQIRLIIRDNGLGFDRLGSSSGHFGLKIMHERAEAIGATLRIISRPEQGTEVELIWPGTV